MMQELVVHGQLQEQPPKFNPSEHLMEIKNKQGATDYLPVQWRLVWFRELCPQGTIDTEAITIDLDRETEEEVYIWNPEKRRSEKIIKRAPGIAIFKAVVTDGKGGRATGYKSEKAAAFPDYIEKAETGSIGRALAALGYGTQFAPELNEEHRIVDSPVDAHPRKPTPQEQEAYKQRRTFVDAVPNLATEQQLTSIRKLCEHLDKTPPSAEDVDSMTYASAKELIATLSQEYRKMRNTQEPSPQNGNAPAEELVIAPMPDALRTRCKFLNKDYATLVKMVKKGQLVPDEELSMEDRKSMHKLVVGWESHSAK